MKIKPSPRKIFIESFIARTTPLLQKQHKGNNLSKYENDILELGQVISEIENSFDLLKLFPKFITTHSSSFEKKGFTRVHQHRKNIEWYLNEVYIFKERVIRFLTLMKRKLIKKHFLKTSTEIQLIDSLKKTFLDSVDGLIKTRGEHVHVFSYQDKDLHHIELLDVAYRTFDLLPENKKDIYEDLKFYLYIQRKQWKERIEKNTSILTKLLDYIYLAIEKENLINKTII
ncbi:hypothetical protein KJ980_07595 [Patescibacteria group bacterium]|nr:hypothetical protein [Patescibacteria group bacterium]MBU4016360.1 hypothetical protein [Patescibacteria group bacterium]MBU4099485.1 hypothetical protein [Patescibacteria group bacterium]